MKNICYKYWIIYYFMVRYSYKNWINEKGEVLLQRRCAKKRQLS